MTPGEGAGAADLAREADFQLGGLTVSPSTGRVTSAGREQRVQPRVMEVLVLLVRNAGRTVTRDELIEACWAGRFVSENAVNRVLGQVRALSRLADPPPFVLETLPKVGVRLIAPAVDARAVASAPGDSGASAEPFRRFYRRSTALVALAAVVVTLGIGWLVAQGWASGVGQNGRVEVVGFASEPEDPAVGRVATLASDTLISVLSRSGVTMAGEPGRVRKQDRGAELRVAGAVSRAGRDYAFDTRIVDRRSSIGGRGSCCGRIGSC